MEHVVLTDGELAEMLKVSRSTIRRMWWRKQLPPPMQVGVLNRWRKTVIDTWLNEQPGNELYDDSAERKLV